MPERAGTLVVHTGGIGDFLLACPALAQLRDEAGPLTLAGQPDRLALGVAGGIAQAARHLDALDFHSVFTARSARFDEAMARFTGAVVWMRDGEGRIAQALREAGVADVRVFPGLPPEDWTSHATSYYAQCLDYGPLPPWRLRVPAERPAPDVVLHPGSGGRQKNWPIEHFAAVARALGRAGWQVAWLVGPAEEGLRLPAGRTLCYRESLVEVAQLLTGARLYLGNDSGITHLAAAVACPVVAVFGPTDPAVWAPRGEHVHVLHGVPWPDPASVIRAAEAALAQPR